jgi:hypothetical protein
LPTSRARLSNGNRAIAPPNSVVSERRFTARSLPCFRPKGIAHLDTAALRDLKPAEDRNGVNNRHSGGAYLIRRRPFGRQRGSCARSSPVGISPIEAAILVKHERERWRKIVETIGVTLD